MFPPSDDGYAVGHAGHVAPDTYLFAFAVTDATGFVQLSGVHVVSVALL